MDSEKDTVEYLNDQLRNQSPDHYAEGWRVVKYAHYEDVEEAHQIQVSRGEDGADSVGWTAAGRAPDKALKVAIMMMRSGALRPLTNRLAL